jgi:hypothetical protein
MTNEWFGDGDGEGER